jgi:hypothetical protein
MTEANKAVDAVFTLLVCSVCGLEVAYEVFGRSHPSEPQIEWRESTYLRRDPWVREGVERREKRKR